MKIASKIFGLFVFSLFIFRSIKSQQIFFSENFERNTLDSTWHRISGNWHIADVQDKKIAPAENGNQYVLSSGGSGLLYLFVDIPATIKASQVKLSFSYYTYSKGPAPSIQFDFYKKNFKDGNKGKLWKAVLPVKGRWMTFSKILKIPAEANMVWLTFYEAPSTGKVPGSVCFDNVTLSSIP